MVNTKLFKKLKNGNSVETFFKQDEDITYTIRLDYRSNKFYAHYYFFDGNDVSDESNYKDECEISFSELTDLLNKLQLKFPGIQVIV